MLLFLVLNESPACAGGCSVLIYSITLYSIHVAIKARLHKNWSSYIRQAFDSVTD